MPRDISISRDEAEGLVDMLEKAAGADTDQRPVADWRLMLAAEIREIFGMSTKERSDQFKKEHGLK